MKTLQEIQDRIQSIQDRIRLLEQKYKAEKDKRLKDRDRQLMKFLLEEQSIYRFALSQLTWVLETDDDG